MVRHQYGNICVTSTWVSFKVEGLAEGVIIKATIKIRMDRVRMGKEEYLEWG